MIYILHPQTQTGWFPMHCGAVTAAASQLASIHGGP